MNGTRTGRQGLRTCAHIALLVGAACATVRARAGDAEEIRAAHRQFISAINAGDLDRAFTYVADDFVAMPECGPNRTRAEFHDGFIPFLDRFRPSYDFAVQELVITGDWAYERIQYSGTVTPKAGGPARATSWRALAIWRRQRSGAWKVSRYIRTPDRGTPVAC
jgi:ketosteroid isomerase-like protein